MRTTPRSFYELFVQPNYWEYQREPDDARRGFNLAVPAFQLTDIFYEFYSKEDPAIIQPWSSKTSLLMHLASIEPTFLTVQSVATVYKHLYARGGHYEVGSPGAVWGISIPDAEIELQGDWDEKKSDLLVKRRDGSTVSLSHAFERVVEHMWPNFLPSESD